MEYAEFVTDYPEFGENGPSEARIKSALRRAALSVSRSAFGTRYDLAQGLLAAHYLASSPMGSTERVMWDTQETVYMRNFRRVQREVLLTWGHT